MAVEKRRKKGRVSLYGKHARTLSHGGGQRIAIIHGLTLR